ncbi:MAG TPA: CAP domain-containing protein, partial [Patescibacteria group bacterium]|nr:CAP domain-containing protein [Patescibacteria group bacterium]
RATLEPTPPSAHATTTPSPAARAGVIAVAAAPKAASTARAGSSVAAASASASPMTWLERLNFYRSSNGLRPVGDNSRLSAAVAAHAHYLLSNFTDAILSAKPIPSDAYDEEPGKNGYSVEGARVAPDLQLAWGCSTYHASQQIDRWLEGPFHRLSMLDPYLADIGYGEVSENGCWVAALRLPPPPEDVKPYRRAVEFPPEGADIALEWIGLEVPDALASCNGYERPVGLPITLEIGRLVQTKLTDHSLTEDGKPVESCAFDAPGYSNAIPSEQEYGRWNLRNAGAIVLVPRAPLRPGSRYHVSITTNDVTYAWSFTAAKSSETSFSASASFPTPEPIATTTPTPIASHPRRTAERAPRATAVPVAPESAPAPASNEEAGVAGVSVNWLTVLNAYRTRLNLPPVVEDPGLSRGCLAHAKYLMMNYGASFRNLGILMHQEDASKPGYSAEGLKAAHASDVVYQPRKNMNEDQLMAQAVEWWISAPFHRAQLLNPELSQVGFAQYCQGSRCVSAMNTTSDAPLASLSGRSLAEPIKVPPDGATVKATAFGGEWPNPVSSCPGYATASPAITLNLGVNVAAKISDAHLTQTTGAAAGTIVDTCSYDSDSYTNPDAGAQAQGREVLRSFGEVVMMVRDPLIGGESYRVVMTVNNQPYTWSFTALK